MHKFEFQESFLDYLSAAVLIADRNHQLQFINNSAEELFGISRRKAQSVDLKTIEINCAPGTLYACIDRSMREMQTYTYREIIVQSPFTEAHAVNCTVTPMYPDGAIAGAIVEFSNVDRIKRIAMEEQLMIQQTAAREIARGLAHEINNPLGGLRGAAQLLEREIPAAAKEYTQIIIAEADRLQKLVKSMLGPNAKPVMSEVNIHEVLDHVIKLVKADSDDQCQFQIDFDPSIPAIKADRGNIIQAVLNIVRNAWQAVEKKGEIRLKTRVHRSYTIGHVFHKLVLQIDISDNGPGIAEDRLEQIFYPMITSRAEGTGLGLTISQSIVNLHGGLIECSSKPGATTFSILLPIDNDSERKDD